MHGTYEKLILRPLHRILALKEREANKQPANDVQHHLSQDIRRAAPVALERTLEQEVQLHTPGARECALLDGVHRRLVAALSVDVLDLVLHDVGLA